MKINQNNIRHSEDKNRLKNIISLIKKYTLIIVANVFFFILLLLISDFLFYSISLNNHNFFNLNNIKDIYTIKYTYITDIKEYFSGKTNDYRSGRLPDGLRYKEKPIIIFGCSYAFGQNLKPNETFSYYLSEILKRPVFNRALCGAGFQHMYFQSTSDYFYNDVPPSDTVIYVVIDDHFRRLFGETFNIYENWYYLHYDYINGNLYKSEYNNFISAFLKKSYTLKFLRKLYIEKYMKDRKNEQLIADEALAYFIKTRENLENKWHNKINFIVFFIQDDYFCRAIIPKLEKNNFSVIQLNSFNEYAFNIIKYNQPDGHPTASFWEDVTPMFVKRMKQRN